MQPRSALPRGRRWDGPRALTQVAGVDSRADAVFVGVRLHAVRSVHLVFPEDRAAEARAVAANLGALHISTRLHPGARRDLPGLIDLVAGILNAEPEGQAVVNLSSGWEEYSFAALTAAFLTGAAAFAVQDEDVVTVPVLRVSYPEVLSPAKVRIIRKLSEMGGTGLVKDLAEAAKLSPSLVSYHLRGYRDRPGLEQMGLVEGAEADGRGHAVRLTPLGRSLLTVRPRPEEAALRGAGAVARSHR